MLHANMTKHEFGTKLHELVSPAQPIQSIEHLVGRAEELDRIEKALFAPGRNVFIYGARAYFPHFEIKLSAIYSRVVL